MALQDATLHTRQLRWGEQAVRVEAVETEMSQRGLAALVVASPQNIYYLSGLDFLGYFAWPLLLIIPGEPPVLVTRAMERPLVANQVPHCVHVGYHDGEDPAEATARALQQRLRLGGAVGLESWYLPFGVGQRLQASTPRLHWSDATGLVERVSVRKSTTEIGFIHKAAAISDLGMQTGLAATAVGVRDNEVAAAVYQAMIAAGSEYPAAPPIIRRTDFIDHDHLTWTGCEVRPGDGLFLELSASVGRYHAPLTRMVHVAPLSPQVEEAAEIARAGYEAIRDTLRPGAISGEIHQAWEKAVGNADTGPRPIHQHCGYLVGAGFPPTWMEGTPLIALRPEGNLTIQEAMIFHLVSWIRYPTGYAISDTALVTTDGCQIVTTTPHGPPVTI